MITATIETIKRGISKIIIYRDNTRIDEFLTDTAKQREAVDSAIKYHEMKNAVVTCTAADIIVRLRGITRPHSADIIAGLIINKIVPVYKEVVDGVEIKYYE